LKEKINESISNFSKNIFTELDEVYEKTGIKSDIQIKESDISSFADVKSENDLKQKIDNFKNKIEKIKAQLVETQNEITDKYQTQIKESLTLKSKEKEKQVEVLNFMRDSGFDLIPKEISDKFIQQLQSNTLNIP
jgi:septal ring factor EnvC (AmiA/AmiB activator)